MTLRTLHSLISWFVRAAAGSVSKAVLATLAIIRALVVGAPAGGIVQMA
jgi:hypothetical protein